MPPNTALDENSAPFQVYLCNLWIVGASKRVYERVELVYGEKKWWIF